MKRQHIVAGNWKMNTTLEEGIALAKAVVADATDTGTKIVLCTPYTHLGAIKEIIKGSSFIHLGAQNCSEHEAGAYTGEISIPMLQSVGVEYIILGHSERREYFKESDALLANKVNKVLAAGLVPIFCCGEPLEIREKGIEIAHVTAQIEASLFHLSAEDFQKVVIAYEPIWAIGTGKTASSEQAQEMHKALRTFIAGKYGQEVANSITIQYGGSCKPSNAQEIFAKEDVDGGLIGGAALVASDFLAIVNAF